MTTFISKWLLVASLLSFNLAIAQTEPTLSQVYSTVQAGHLDQAQIMIQQVLVLHPNSAKAFFIQSELYARQGEFARSREALATAERLAPGLPFAKAEAVRALRSQLTNRMKPIAGNDSLTHSVPSQAASHEKSFSWAPTLFVSIVVIAFGYFLFRKKKPDTLMQPSKYVPQNDLNGPQTFGAGTSSYGPSTYANQAGMQQPYGQTSGSGLGGRIMGGVATGLAVGAGLMAAEAIGKNLMGGHNPPATNGADDNFSNNSDLGGQNFGINDASSWDDGGGIDVGGGNDWDN